MTAPATNQRRSMVLLRPVPGTSPIHELWAGTKLVMVALIGVVLTVYPGWVPIGLVALLIVLTAWLAHIPRGVLPTVPRAVWLLMLLGAGTAALAGGTPFVVVGSAHVGLGGFLNFMQITVLSIVLLGLGGLVSWTTNVAEIAPAVATLGRPLRWLRIPIDEWAVTLALGLRAFPMLIDEYRVLFAARRLRPRPEPTNRRERSRRRRADIVDMLAAAVTVALRRGDEMGDAITARGGVGQIVASPARPGRADAMALLLVVAMCALSVWVEVYTPLATSKH
ncbi:energy-coupling factor transporter transmembrane protein EcfT [Mycobacterium sp. CBMA293]|uniref:energy-coupling factor transporter transmembrane component T family protein n=1 Tax=unclassified Mycolicibacterium TaxID=2636767 RepID=UPI0012DDEDAB|nr:MULTISPECIES: energy-coupling factor transporter transmembrane protein EcfT [unclassified Mycolicibacterium]MUL45672.1 energy-coupling factor transporter transmembrane protein EcfT [Mycolicibacterium sp. CBMA 360]MUL60343.1 energy-coupling factor transporter transmembrane protein EcfT [Mycolicibacterium sp. CBMA 335]MUL71445.1 energy-coupling factor transporter transmembrane protein EcfT [Mycolicibacterium sp. CBMA 311]MUL73130.1 energy-coupling factor transporter transmembrane protein EcfT 